MEVAEVLLQAGGVASTAALVELVGRPALRRAVESGAVMRAGRGTYRLPESEEHRVDAARLHACLSLTSAALAHGWPVKLPPSRPQVVVPRGRKVEAARRSRVELRWGEVTPRELAAGVTDPVRTVLDCARFLATDEALAVADSALRAGVPRTDLLLACARLPRHGRGRAFRIVELATSLAANPFESVLRAVLLDVPGARFEPQVWIGEHRSHRPGGPATPHRRGGRQLRVPRRSGRVRRRHGALQRLRRARAGSCCGSPGGT